VVAGDFKDSDVADAIEPIMGAVAAELKKRAGNRKICVFLPLVASSKRFAQTLRDYGFDSEHVDGKSDDRKEILARFSKKGGGSALCNSALLTEGWDEPSVDCIVVLSPTRSTVRYIQMIGRGTRLFPGKQNLYVPDFLWHGANHNLCHPACLVAKTPEVAEKMRQIQDKKQGCANIKALEEEAHSSLVEERERALAENLKAFVGSKSKKFDPVLHSISLVDDSIVSWIPETKTEAQPATETQISILERHGFDATGMKRGYADKIISNIMDRCKNNLSTPKQVRLLLKHGHADAYKMSFDQASKEITRIVARGGKRYAKR
jgi:restriction endonuclease